MAPAIIDDETGGLRKALTHPTPLSFPSGQPVWSVPGRPEESVQYGEIGESESVTFTPEVRGEYRVEAACGTSSASCGITAHELCLERDGTEITGGTFTTVVGKKIHLAAEIKPPLPGDVDYHWTIPGEFVKDYITTNILGDPIEMTLDDFDHQFCQFNWTKDLTAQSIIVHIISQSLDPHSAATSVNVLRPSGSKLYGTTIDNDAVGFRNNQLIFGNPPVEDGIFFEASTVAPNIEEAAGTIALIQQIGSYGRLDFTDGSSLTQSTGGDWWLDSKMMSYI